jgi:hypothetical protein
MIVNKTHATGTAPARRNRFAASAKLALAAGAIAAGAIALTPAVANATPIHARPALGEDQGFCHFIGGTFTTEIFGGTTHSTCSLADGNHHLYYTDGDFTGSD